MLGTERWVCLSFLVVGVTSLLPWNLFITAHNYFFYKLRDVDGPRNQTSYLQKTFEVWFTLTSSGIMLIGTIVTLGLSQMFTNKFRMIIGHIVVMFSIMPTIILAIVNTDSWQKDFFVFTLILINICAFFAAFIQSSVTGLAAMFPPKNMQMMIIGQALAGIITSILSILSQAVAHSENWDGLIYFSIALSITCVSLVVYLVLISSKYAKEKMDLDSDSDNGGGGGGVDPETEPLVGNNEIHVHGDWVDRTFHTHVGVHHHQHHHPRLVVAFKKIGFECCNLVLIFSLTLALFPPLTSLTVSKSDNSRWRAYFIPVTCFLLFNCTDAIGRMIMKWIKWPDSKSWWMLFLVLLRFTLIPLFLFCNVQPREHTQVLFTKDWIFVLLMIILGLSNGYLATINIVSAPTRVEHYESELAGTMLGIAIPLGVFLGSALSYGLVDLV